MATSSATSDNFEYVSDEKLNVNDWNDVVIALKDVQEDWEDLGIRLKILESTMKRILHIPSPDGSHSKHLSQLIAAWLKKQRPTDHPSWRQLCQALYAMEKWDLANEIAQKHTIPGVSIPNSSSVTSDKKKEVGHTQQQRQLATTEGNHRNSDAINLTLNEIDEVDDASVQQQEFELVCINETCVDDSIPSRTTRSQDSDEQGCVEIDECKAGGGDERKRYLAVTITNSYLNTKKPLKGVKHDYKQLCETFDMPSVMHIKGRNVSMDDLKKLLNETKAAVKKSSDARQPYEIAFVVFSGHGGIINQNTSFILTEERRANQELPKVVLNSVFNCFLQIIGDAVPTFFIIDACRDLVKDAPKGLTQPAHSYLVGYATANGTESWSNTKNGSYWVQAVSKGLKTKKKPVIDVLKEAKEEVIQQKPIQIPEIDDRNLNEEHKNVQLNIVYPVEENDGGEVATNRFFRWFSLFDRRKNGGTSTHCQDYWYIYAVIVLILGVLAGMVMINHSGYQTAAPPTDQELLEIFSPITTSLRSLCINLELDSGECNEIFDDRTNTYEDQRHGVLKLWHKMKDPDWDDLVKGLDRINQCKVAKELAIKHSLEHLLKRCKS